MRFWLVISWRRAWANEGMDMRVFDDKDRAATVAQVHNGVLVEVFQSEKDFLTYVDVHDYEFRDKNDAPQSTNWVEETTMDLVKHTWVTTRSPVMRVGKDISKKAYQELVKADG